MKISELNLPSEVKSRFQFKYLNPPQKMAVEAGVLDYNNMIVASPTASGKTLIAEFAFLKNILERKKKAIYIVPLRALAYEKYQSFQKYSDLFKIAISVGDYDSADNWLDKYDLIIVTSEKMDSLLRHNPPWVEDIGLVVADEIHLLNDETRGPTLEVILTRLIKDTEAQVLGLSATISNAREIADWLDAELITSSFRPVKLYEGVYNGEKVEFLEKEDFFLNKISRSIKGEVLLAEETVKKSKQALVFAASRRNAESIAEKTSEVVGSSLPRKERKALNKVAEKILQVPSYPTRQCKKLAECVRKGTAFHHAGLTHKQRVLVEDSFRNNLIKIISATPTLAAGVNLPAYRVLIRDAKRYYSGYGSRFIPVLEYQQMIGRAGRPQFDKEGEAILIAENENDAELLRDHFLLGNAEEIFSKLSVEPILRMHVLSLISTEVTTTEEDLKDFLSETFFAYQFGDISKIEEKLVSILKRLQDQRFITWIGENLQPTRIGKRVSELYLDTETAYYILEGLESQRISDFGLLALISNTREMRPLRLKSREYQVIQEKIAEREEEFITRSPDPWDFEYDDFLGAVKTALMFEQWCNEKGEDYLLERYDATPGELRSKIEKADWLLYSCQELAFLLGQHDKIKHIRKARVRIKYGIKEELVPLVSLKGIGRVKARRLFNSGFKTVYSIKKAPLLTLVSLIGDKTARNLKKQLTRKEDRQEILND